MLALQDRDHICRATVPALAKICNITNELCEEYLTDFQQPDKYSRSQEHEGRRVERVEGGYLILNGAHYQRLLSKEDRREYIRKKVSEHRQKRRDDVNTGNQDVNTGKQAVNKSNQSKHTKTKTKTKTCSVRDLPTVETHVELPKPATSMNVDLVFTHWKETLKHPDARLTAKRQQRILQRLKEGYSVDDLRAAIDGCAKSAFHMGDNANGKVYDDIELICRSGEKVEQFKEQTAPLAIPKPQSRVGAQAKPVAVETDRVESAEMISTWNDLADAMGEPLEKLVRKSVALGQLSKDDARMILGESNAQ